MAIKLIVGLGNPGSDYANTRHNVGAWLVDEIARDTGIHLKNESKFYGSTGAGQIAGSPCRLLIPSTYMNESGQSVLAVAHFYKIMPEEILVAHDELDFEPGTLRLKVGGGHGGHNGLRDIIKRLAGSADFLRARIGIGHPGDKNRVTNYVLNKPSTKDLQAIDNSFIEFHRALPDIMAGKVEKAMKALHS